MNILVCMPQTEGRSSLLHLTHHLELLNYFNAFSVNHRDVNFFIVLPPEMETRVSILLCLVCYSQTDFNQSYTVVLRLVAIQAVQH